MAIHFTVGLPLEVVTGLLAGGTTNTPSLAAAAADADRAACATTQVAVPGLAYAVAVSLRHRRHPAHDGLTRMIFRVSVPAEATLSPSAHDASQPMRTNEHRNPQCSAVEGAALPEVPGLRDVAMGVIVSRVMHDGSQHVAMPTDVFHVGDVVLCQRPPSAAREAARHAWGGSADSSCTRSSVRLPARDMLVTRNKIVGERISDLHIRDLYGVTIASLNRAGVDLAPSAGVKLQLGDYITCVGEEAQLKQVETMVGNKASALNHTQIIPIFIGIALGVLLGGIPIYVPGMPAPLGLGLAGGPVVVAIILSRIGTIGPLR